MGNDIWSQGNNNLIWQGIGGAAGLVWSTTEPAREATGNFLNWFGNQITGSGNENNNNPVELPKTDNPFVFGESRADSFNTDINKDFEFQSPFTPFILPQTGSDIGIPEAETGIRTDLNHPDIPPEWLNIPNTEIPNFNPNDINTPDFGDPSIIPEPPTTNNSSPSVDIQDSIFTFPGTGEIITDTSNNPDVQKEEEALDKRYEDAFKDYGTTTSEILNNDITDPDTEFDKLETISDYLKNEQEYLENLEKEQPEIFNKSGKLITHKLKIESLLNSSDLGGRIEALQEKLADANGTISDRLKGRIDDVYSDIKLLNPNTEKLIETISEKDRVIPDGTGTTTYLDTGTELAFEGWIENGLKSNPEEYGKLSNKLKRIEEAGINPSKQGKERFPGIGNGQQNGRNLEGNVIEIKVNNSTLRVYGTVNSEGKLVILNWGSDKKTQNKDIEKAQQLVRDNF